MSLHLLIKENNDENKVSQSIEIMQIGRGQWKWRMYILDMSQDLAILSDRFGIMRYQKL